MLNLELSVDEVKEMLKNDSIVLSNVRVEAAFHRRYSLQQLEFLKMYKSA